MLQLTSTARGQVTLRKDIFRHLGILPGAKIEVDMLPGGECRLRAPQAHLTTKEIIGLLKGKSKEVATLEEMDDAIAKGWAGKIDI